MAKLLPYPHFVINVDDQSGYTEPAEEENLGLHVPMFFVKSPKGTPNTPVYYQDTNSLTKAIGSQVFDKSTEYFGVDSLFLETNFSMQGAFVTRLVPDDSKTSTVLIECHLTKDVDVVQYQRDALGGVKRDAHGDPIPVQDTVTNAPITEKGVKIKYVRRELDPTTESKFKEIKPKTLTVDGKETIVYPVVAGIANNVGKCGDNLGFRLYYDNAEQQSDRMETNKALEYSFAPVEKDYTDSTPTSLWTRWNTAYSTFMLKPKQYDSKVAQNISYKEVLEENYLEGKTSELPMTVYFYEDYIKLIGAAIQTVEVNDTAITDPFMVNILTGLNTKGYSYHHVTFDTNGSTVFFNSSYTIYLNGGSDGSIDTESFQELMRQFLTMKTYPRLKDKFKFPITHLYDTGYNMLTKEALIAFLGYRDDIKVELSTQDLGNEINDESEDQSTGVYLRTRALLQVESTLKGVQCCRCGVNAHSGKVYDARWTGYVPATLDILKKRCTYQSTGYMKGEPKERPNSEVTIFKSLNWTAYDEDNKALFWDSGINYIQHCSRKELFYPDLRTVHPVESSVLTEWSFVDAVVYTKHKIASAWTMFSGSTAPAEDLFPAIQKYINDRLTDAFGSRYPLRVKVFQTEVDAKRGFILRVQIYLTGRNGRRVWESEIITLKDETVYSTSSSEG